MNREEVLEKSRKENNDEMIIDALTKSGNAASKAGIIMAVIVFFADSFVFGKGNYAVLGIYFGMMAVQYIVAYSKLNEKKDLRWGVFLAFLSIFSFTDHFIR